MGCTIAAAALATGGTAVAADYPNRPVRVIIPYAAGGPVDVVARPVMQRMSERLGQQFVLESRAGAGGATGTEATAKAAPDGYTMLITTAGPIMIQPKLRPASYDADRDLQPVAKLADQVTGLGVSPSLGISTMAGLIERARQKPDSISYGSAGYGSLGHLRVEMLQHQAGIHLIHVPYKGGAEAMTDLLAGNIQLLFDTLTFAHAKAGKVVLLAVLDDERHPDFPDLPTVKQAGLRDYEVPQWLIVFVPKQTPAPIVQQLNAEIAAISRDPELSQAMRIAGYKLRADSVTDLETTLKHEAAALDRLFKEVNIRLP